MARTLTESFDYTTNTFYRHWAEDVAPLLDSLAEQRNHAVDKKTEANYRHVASIPNSVVEMWLREDPPFNLLDGRPETQKEVMRRLNGDWKLLKATDKTL